MKRLVIIDAHSIIHRAFHALPPLSAPDGRPIQAIYGLARILLSILNRAPDYIVAGSDTKEATFRKEAYDDYKAHRAQTPDDLESQMEEAKELFRRLNIPFFEVPGMEADDIIATIATKFMDERDLRIEILSSDSDLFQLVRGDRVVIQTFKKGMGDTIVYNEDALRERYGLSPAQMVDYKALVGDTSDNVKGVPGIGPKTATALLQEFGSIEKLYKNLDKAPKYKEKLEANRESLMFSKMLVTLKTDVPLDIASLDALRLAPRDTEALAAYFTELGFTSLVRQLQKKGAEAPQPKAPPARRSKTKKIAAIRGPLFGASAVPADAAVDEAGEAEPTPALPGDVLVIDDAILQKSRDLASSKIKAGFDLKPLLRAVWEDGKDIAPPYADLGVAFWLLHPDLHNYEPEVIFGAVLKRTYHGTADDIRIAYQESQRLLAKSGMRKIYEDVEMPLLRVLAEMERWGIYVSEKKLTGLEQEMRNAVDELTKQIYKLAGGEFNLNSPRQVGEVLFEKLHIQDADGKKGGRKQAGSSTRFDVLSELRDAHPIVPLILKYREDFKMLSTYVAPLLSLRDADGMLHTEYIQTGAATGRLSSRAPNMQNIPQGSSWSKPLRSAFEARPGHTLVAYDYSQLELRILASLADDPDMKAAFEKGEDIHTRTAAVVLGKKDDEVTRDERRIAKTLNFGLMYGMGVRAFAKESGLQQKQAKEFIDRYFREFGAVRAWQEHTKEYARTHGHTETLTGRKRYFPELQAYSRPHIVAEAERAAINHPVQGLEADIVKLAMLAVKDLLVKEDVWGDGARMLLNIHDELLFEIRDDMIDALVRPIRGKMENIFPALRVPLRVDVHTGKDWGTMKAYA